MNLISKGYPNIKGYWIEKLLVEVESLDYKFTMKSYVDPGLTLLFNLYYKFIIEFFFNTYF